MSEVGDFQGNVTNPDDEEKSIISFENDIAGFNGF